MAEADALKGYRLSLGEDRDGNPRLSPWLPHPDSGGGNKSWRPLSRGQIVAAISPGGDLPQGFLLRAGFGGQDPPPSQDLAEVVLLDNGAVRISATQHACVVKVGDTVLSITADGITMQAPTIDAFGDEVRHNGHEIGDKHVHLRVMTGLDRSGPPP
ncbi:baseplate assembly protein [Xanthobacter sediminis]